LVADAIGHIATFGNFIEATGSSKRRQTHIQGNSMTLLAIFLGIVLAGDLVAVGVGEILDRIYPPVSLPVFLLMFFGVFYFGWLLALRLTDPKRKAARAS
jgi:hypothetical protein